MSCNIWEAWWEEAYLVSSTLLRATAKPTCDSGFGRASGDLTGLRAPVGLWKIVLPRESHRSVPTLTAVFECVFLNFAEYIPSF